MSTESCSVTAGATDVLMTTVTDTWAAPALCPVTHTANWSLAVRTVSTDLLHAQDGRRGPSRSTPSTCNAGAQVGNDDSSPILHARPSIPA
jgi:hypothetical protein